MREMEDVRKQTGDARQEIGDRDGRWETGGRRWGKGDVRQEIGGKRLQTGDGRHEPQRQETGDRRWERC